MLAKQNLQHIKPGNKELLSSLQQPLRTVRDSVDGGQVSLGSYRNQFVGQSVQFGQAKMS